MPPDQPELTDPELIQRTLAGQTAAFDQLIRRHHTRLYATIYHMTSHREDTLDLLQEIFARAYRSLDRFRGQSQFYTWLHTIGVNLTLNFLKKRRRRQPSLSLDALDPSIENDLELTQAARTRSPAKEAELKDLQKKLNEAMQRLSEDHRMVVTLYDIQGHQHTEIAKMLGVSEGTVRSRLFYAHRQLQSHLDEFWKP
jgi:RNA polymerase sigma factor (sigma-70 family)